MDVVGVGADSFQYPQCLGQYLVSDSVAGHCDYCMFCHECVSPKNFSPQRHRGTESFWLPPRRCMQRLDSRLQFRPRRFATRFSTPSAMTSDCGTLPSAGNANFSPRQWITPEVKSMSISSPGMIVFSFAEISLARSEERCFTRSGTSTQRKPLLYALRR